DLLTALEHPITEQSSLPVKRWFEISRQSEELRVIRVDVGGQVLKRNARLNSPSSTSGRRCVMLRDDSKLLHHAEHVHLDPVLDDLSILKAIHSEVWHLDLLPGCWDVYELAIVRAS